MKELLEVIIPMAVALVPIAVHLSNMNRRIKLLFRLCYLLAQSNDYSLIVYLIEQEERSATREIK